MWIDINKISIFFYNLYPYDVKTLSAGWSY